MSEEEKAQLRAMLKPGSREPTAAEYEVLRAFRDEYTRRLYGAIRPPTPGDVRRMIEETAREHGVGHERRGQRQDRGARMSD